MLDEATSEREISESERVIRELYGITADHQLGFEVQVKRLLRMGLERFDLDIGILAHVSDGIYRVVHTVLSDPALGLQDGDCFELGSTYCSITLGANEPQGFEEMGQSEYKAHPAYMAFGLEAYIGTPVVVDGEVYGTINFSSPAVRKRAFQSVDIDCLKLMASWVGGEIKRRRMEMDLKTTVERLERSNEQLAGFAYRVSHDLQEPLRSIRAYADLLDRRYNDDLDDKAKGWLRHLARGAQRMQQLVTDLLAYARLDGMDLPATSTSCSSVVGTALGNLSQAIEDSGATVEVGQMPAVAAHPAPLLQLFQNLIGNALKYRGEETPVIAVSVTTSGDTAVFAIRDNGIGIPAEHLGRIFERFTRMAPHGSQQGTGIGLSTCKNVVERYKGRIWVESQVGQGSTFYFTLPLASTTDEA